MKYYASKISENIRETPEGFLVCLSVPIARTGEMIYAEGETPLEVDEEGKIVIERSPAEVFRPETIASFEGKAVTIMHPEEFVSPENWSSLAKGILQNVRRGEGDQKDDLIADLLITDRIAIGLVKNGLREVSCGYEAEYTQVGKGRGIQTNIIGNHLALVDQGRAGSSYAINDHKGKGTLMKLSEKIKSIFAKAQDEAMKLAETTDAELKEDKSGEKKDDKAKDEMSMDAAAYDAMMKAVKDLSDKVEAFMGKKKDEKKEGADASTEATENEPAKVVAKDDEVAPGLEDRLKKLEMAVAKLLEGQSQSGDADESDEEEESESEDDDFDESLMTGDAASRLEILAPGMKPCKDFKTKALKQAYDTKEGKKIIDGLSGGKPTFDSAEKIDTLFVAASELLKVSRNSDLSKTKQTRDFDSGSSKGVMTAEQLNEINQKFYAQAK